MNCQTKLFLAYVFLFLYALTPARAVETGRQLDLHPGPMSAATGVDHGAEKLGAARGGVPDSDADGHPDFADNCSDVANSSQHDSDADGYGNLCDGDFNNDGITNFEDLDMMKSAFFSNPFQPSWNPHVDMNNDLVVNFSDLDLLKSRFFDPPGPSGMSCAGSPPCPDPQFGFIWPMPGNDAQHWVINNYVDLDAGGGILDYMGGAKSYDGHRGVDIDVPTFRAMDNNFPIFAVEDGVVLALEDSNFDRNTSCVGNWNFVTLGHPNGWRTIYGHLKMDSVVVNVGDTVSAGDVLGVVGSSGCSTAPHLHLETLDPGGNVVSPFLGNLWLTPPVYDTPLGFMDAALFNGPISSVNMIKDPPDNAEIAPPGQTFGIGLSLGGGDSGDIINLRIRKGANLIASNNFFPAGPLRHSYWWWNYSFPASASGSHVLEVRLNGALAASYNIYVGPIYSGFWQVRHGVPIANYQQLFNDLTANGYRLIWVDGYDVGNATFMNAIFNQSTVPTWTAAHDLDSTQFQDYFDAEVAAGRRMTHVDSYIRAGTMRFAAIFVQQAGTAWIAYHGISQAQHQSNFNSLTSQGFFPKVISVVEIGGANRYTAFYNQDPVGSLVALAGLTSAQYQTEFNNQAAAGRKLVYLNGYTSGGTNRFSAIWTGVGPSAWVAHHDLSSSQFQTAFDNWTGQGLITRIVTGYERNNVANFAGMWSN